MSKNKMLLSSYEALEDFVDFVLSKFSDVGVICLHGNLGVGKTTFARYAIQKILDNDQILVTSPTFNIMQIYEGPSKNGNKNKIVYHYDLYRLKSLEEVYELGIEETINQGINIIEWPELLLNHLPAETLHIMMEFDNEGCRWGWILQE
jgi:tRNA threonylcarbamoyladenosine biosynthesis protein TsaE